MPTCCIVPGCTSGYKSNKEKVNFFSIPKDETLRQKWQCAIRRKDIVLKSEHRICSNHFHAEDILWKKSLLRPDGTVIGESPYKKPQLKPNTVPMLFPWFETSEEQSSSGIKSPKHPELQSSTNIISMDLENNWSSEDLILHNCDKNSNFLFENFIREPIILPNSWIQNVYDVGNEKVVIFSMTNYKKIDGIIIPLYSKEVFVSSNLELRLKVNGTVLDISKYKIQNSVTDLQVFQDTLFAIHSLNVCSGIELSNNSESIDCSVTSIDCYKTIRHKKCVLLSDSVQCEYCHRVKKTIARKKLRQMNQQNCLRLHLQNVTSDKKAHITKMKKKLLRSIEKNSSLKADNIKLKISLSECYQKMSIINENTILDILKKSNIPKCQQDAVFEIWKASKCKSRTGHRYSEDWMMLCLLLHMRSPSNYNFLRTNNILPLPCISTIRRNLSTINVTCGFDANFFELLEKFLVQQQDMDKHGCLLFDEMSTRESVAINSQSLTYTGLVDFGEERESKSLNDKANHGLVFMFQPLFASYSQPVAVFASRGPTNGITLAKLIIKAIILLEKAGAKIHGVISDGAATNRKFWSEMGVSGKKNNLKTHFQHPCDNDRKVYVFSDICHLEKTIRNKLYNNGTLQMDPQEPCIKWSHFVTMYEKDHTIPGNLRLCPKITANHLYLNSSAKMRVRLAVQVFSNTMASALEFYSHFLPELKDCTSTISFCRWMNDLFDALNRKSLNDGVKPYDNDYKLIESSLKKLDEWETKVENGSLAESSFLTRQTAEGLRTTLHSTLDLITYLNSIGFKSVPTGKINQDALERFFGSVRQAGCCNDHPNTPTFLQIYRILSLYSILKPPKTGNCTIIETEHSKSLITLGELKQIFNNKEHASSVKFLEEKIRLAAKVDDWRIENFLCEYDYILPNMENCLSYYISQLICNKILKITKCTNCQEALISKESVYISKPIALLETLESSKSSNLFRPHEGFHNLIIKLEEIFQRHCNSKFVYEDVIIDVIDRNFLTFPCDSHAHEILTSIVYIFIRMRIQRHVSECNNNIKENQFKKKQAKFCKI